MIRRAVLLGLALAAATGAARRREAYGPPPPPGPYEVCEYAIARVQPKGMPETLMPAIGRVESGKLDPATRRVHPWPWTINVQGVGYWYDTQEQAVGAVEELQAKGVKSIDVGCMQVNLMYHPDAFPSVEAAFDPATNVAYAAKFLLSLYGLTRNWPLATAMYHSAEQERGEDYQRRVFGQVMTPMGPAKAAGTLASPLPSVDLNYGAFASPGAAFGAFAGAFGGGPLGGGPLGGGQLGGKTGPGGRTLTQRYSRGKAL